MRSYGTILDILFMEKIMEIRLAQREDSDSILKIIQQAQTYLREQNIPQWQNGYPNMDTVIQDIESNRNYVMWDESKIVGTCMLSFDRDPYYEVIEGKWLADEPYVVIHRIAIDTTVKGKGLAASFFKFAELQAKEKGVNYMRIDTHELNQSMRKCIEKNGFKECGIVYVMDHAPRIGYEREI